MSYLNTKPLIYGFEQGMMAEEIELITEYPSLLAQQLKSGNLDIALIPAGALLSIGKYQIISDYCIGATGPVASVCLFSDVPLDKLHSVFLDYQSVTSVALAKILFRDHWKIAPKLLQASPGFEEEIAGQTAGIVIGDRALQLRHKKAFVYDLAEAWIEMTGLPFVFAVWASRENKSPEFKAAFDETTAEGFKYLDEIILGESRSAINYDLKKYYTHDISYNLDAAKRKGLEEFLRLLKTFDEQ